MGDEVLFTVLLLDVALFAPLDNVRPVFLVLEELEKQ
jgi:hypothetical protein